MDASRTPDDRFLRQVFREIPKVSDKQAADLVRAYREDPDALLPLLHTAIGSGKLQKALELYKANLLSAFSTDVANLSGNLVEQGVELMETGLSSKLDWALRRVYGGERARFNGEMGAELAGANQAFGPALKNLGRNLIDVVVKGKRKPIDPSRPLGQQVSALSPTGLGRYTSRVFGKLEVVDQFVKEWGGGGELAKLAYRKASAEMPGKSSKEIAKRADAIVQEVADPTNGDHVDLIRAVEQSKQRRTFQERRADSLTAAVADFVRRKPIVSLALPFVQTPGNIAERIVHRSPYGFVQARKPFAEFKEMQAKQSRGEATQAEVDEARGKLADALAGPLLGTGLLAAFSAVAAAGGMTGGGPTDPKDKNLLRDTGWQPYSFVFPDGQGGKFYVPYNRFEPVSSLLGFAADMVEAKDAKSAGDLGGKFMGSMVSNLTSKAYLQGIADVAEAVTKPMEAGSKFARNVAGSFLVPNIVNRANQAIDPTMRDTKPARSGLAGEAEAVVKTVASRIPFVSGALPERRSGTGEVVERQGNAATRFLLPAPPSKTRRGLELEQILVDLDETPSPPSREMSIPRTNKRVRLSDEEYAFLQQADKAASDYLRGVVVSDAFRRADRDTQKSYVDRVRRQVRSRAHDALWQRPDLRKRAREVVGTAQ